MKVYIPSPLRSYTKDHPVVEAEGETVEELLGELDRRYPGLRFRIITEQGTIRQHIRIVVNEEPARDMAGKLGAEDVVHIICALSGG